MENKQFYFSAIVLCIVMVFIFILQNMFPFLTEEFFLNSAQVISSPWLLITAVFLHGSVIHLLSNIFALGLFGSILEKTIGTKSFLVLFFATGIFASAIAAIFYPASLGASGAIFGILGMLATLRPRMVVWTYGVPMPMFVAVLFWFILDLAGVFFPSSIANIAHIAGLIFGIIVGLTVRSRYPEEKNARKNRLSDEELDKWEEEWM